MKCVYPLATSVSAAPQQDGSARMLDDFPQIKDGQALPSKPDRSMRDARALYDMAERIALRHPYAAQQLERVADLLLRSPPN